MSVEKRRRLNSEKENILSRWSLASRNFVVTGGSNGIGLATVKALLANDASGVLFCSRKPCDSLLSSLEEDYPDATILHSICDVATSVGRTALVHAAKVGFGGKIQGLVNNVGTNIRKPILEQTEEQYHTMMRTNIDSAYFLCREFSDLFDQENSGATIVNVSSAAGVQSSGTGAAYGMSKAAINQFTKILACEWAGRNIRVNAVAPWMTMTPMLEEAVKKNPSQLDKVKDWTPMHRLASSDEIAGPIIFLCLPASSYITGQILGVDGGLTAQGFDGPCCANTSALEEEREEEEESDVNARCSTPEPEPTPRSGIGAHLTPTKKRKRTKEGTPTTYALQGRCKVCQKATTYICSQCKDEKPHGKEPWCCYTKTGKLCFGTHMQACHSV